jgi:hypothetical protein
MMSESGNQGTGLIAVFVQQSDIASRLIVISHEHPEHWHSIIINLIKQAINITDDLVALGIVLGIMADIISELGFGEYDNPFAFARLHRFPIHLRLVWERCSASPRPRRLIFASDCGSPFRIQAATGRSATN